MLERYHFPGAVEPRGPYSHAVRAGDFIYVSGQVPINPVTNEFSYGTIEHETSLVLSNIALILEASGATMADVVKCNVYLKDGGDFAAMNSVYASVFGDNKPARTTVEVKFANPTIKVEIDCIAYRPRSS